MTLRPKSPRAKRKWAVLGLFVILMSGGIVGGVLAGLPQGAAVQFELDKNATNDLSTGAVANKSTSPLGSLAANINNSVAIINVCRFAAAVQPSYPFYIEIEAEQMRVTGTPGGTFGGSCAGTKIRYNVVRGSHYDTVSTTPITAHAANGLNNLVTLLTPGSKLGVDWDTVKDTIDGGDPECLTLDFAACEFVEDGIGDTIYTGGSTKDDLPISGWLHKDGSVPDKDEILNAGAVKATAADGTDAGTNPDQILYVFADRYGVDGSTDMGFWFFKNSVAPINPGSGQTLGFSGAHTDGDILLLSTFTNGGAVTTVRVFRWTGTAQNGTPGTTTGLFGDCVPGAANQNGCATVNDTTIPTGDWVYQAKIAATPSWVPAGGFLEAGINLSDLGLEGCFSGFLAETRSSPSIDATLKDFAFGEFESCGAKIQITPDDVNEVGETHTFTVKVFAGQTGAEQPIAGVSPTVTLNTSGGAVVSNKVDGCVDDGPGGNTGTNAQGECTVSFTSNLSGVVTGHAAATVSFGGGTFNVQTNGEGGSSVDAIKRFVDASISIAPNGVNEVGEDHVFTITVTPEKAGTTIDSISITPSVSPEPGDESSTCGTPVLDAGVYTCTYTISNDTAGVFTANATTTITFEDANDPPNSDTIERSTSGDSGPGGSGPATKRFVDANVSITPTGVNEVGTAHTFTITTVASPSGTTASLTSITPSVSPATTILNSTCASPTTPAGQPNTRTCTFQVNSTSATVFTANAQAVWLFTGTGTPATATVTRDTDPDTAAVAGPGGSGPATKRFVDANVSITPTGVNEVGTAHTFTITTVASPSGTTASLTSITPSVSPATTILNSTCASPTTPAGQPNTRTCTFQVNSTSATVFTANAQAVWLFTGTGTPATATVTRDTDPDTAAVAGPGGSGPATKRFVDANVSITPTGVNEVGTAHTFTITTVASPSGTTASLTSITPSVSPATTILNSTCASPTTPAGQPNTRTCTFQVNSTSATVFTANAQAVWLFTGTGTPATATVTRDTDPDTAAVAGPGGSGPATKRFVDANVSITPTGVNEVGTAHTFTITTVASPSGTTASLTSITPSVSPATTILNSTCASPTTPAGQPNTRTCTFQVNSTSATVFTANAQAVWLFTGTGTPATATVTRDTDPDTAAVAGPGGSGPATKTYVDAYITINPPTATNNVGEEHTVTVLVCRHTGTAALPIEAGDCENGFRPAAAGTPVLVTLTWFDPDAEDPIVLVADNCASPGGLTAIGKCTVTFTSPVPGTVTAHASVTLAFDGLVGSVFRETDGFAPNSGNALKEFKAGSIQWAKYYADALQGGATFDVCRTHRYDIELEEFIAVDEPCKSVVDDVDNDPDLDTLDENPAPGLFKISGVPLGRYTIEETDAPAGYELDPDTETVELTPAAISADISTSDPFVNSRPVVKLTGFGYTNEPVGDQPFGIRKGSTTYTVDLQNFGTAAATLADSTLEVSDNATCVGGNTLDLTGTLAAADLLSDDDTLQFTLTCTYDGPTEPVITADLNVNYETSDFHSRVASGSPATISFTVLAAND